MGYFFLFNYKIENNKNIIILKKNNIIRESFRYLKGYKNIKCYNIISQRCISFNNVVIVNVYFFLSERVYFNYNDKTIISNNFKMYGFKNVILSQDGSIHSHCWDLTTEGGCCCSYITKLSLKSELYKSYEKVVSITHHWGNAVFHSIVECLSKIGYFIPELINDKSIKIHTYKSANVNYLLFLGFNHSRIIYGNILAKRLIVLEKGSCGSTPPIIHLYSLRNILRNKILSKPLYDVILIKRYGIRNILNYDEVKKALNIYYGKNRIGIFYPNTSFSDTLNYFKYAKLIVAPHGAGLSNIILSSNATVVEFLTKNLCYAGLAKKLELKYIGLYEKFEKNSFKINISRFIFAIKNIKI